LRLRDEADFRRLRADGRSWGGRLMTLLARPNDLPHNRYGAIVSKRVGNAVVRNLLKRRLRETLRGLDRAGRIVPGHDLAFIVRPPLAAASFVETEGAVTELLRCGRLLRPAPPARGEEAGTGDGPTGADSAGRGETGAA